MDRPLIVGTRGSALALWQANAVRDLIATTHPGTSAQLGIIKPEGDRDKTSSLLTIGGRGVFASALQEALLDGSIDLAVHSTKDVPTIEPVGLAIAAYPQREDPRDAVVRMIVAAGRPTPATAAILLPAAVDPSFAAEPRAAAITTLLSANDPDALARSVDAIASLVAPNITPLSAT